MTKNYTYYNKIEDTQEEVTIKISRKDYDKLMKLFAELEKCGERLKNA